jgi:hypothetical protein
MLLPESGLDHLDRWPIKRRNRRKSRSRSSFLLRVRPDGAARIVANELDPRSIVRSGRKQGRRRRHLSLQEIAKSTPTATP